MPAKNSRINVVLAANLYKNVQFLAETDGVSLSTKVRDLIPDTTTSVTNGAVIFGATGLRAQLLKTGKP